MKLDHITVIAPTLREGVAHVNDCLGIEVPFGTRHTYMGTHNHRLQLGNNTYLEIVSVDPDGAEPKRARWFGLDDPDRVRSEWDRGQRLRGWVANTESMEDSVSSYGNLFGSVVALPPDASEFDFSIPEDGSLPMDGAMPSLIDHRGNPQSMDEIPDLGARLVSLTLQHPDPEPVEALYSALSITDPPLVVRGPWPGYSAEIETPSGLKVLR